MPRSESTSAVTVQNEIGTDQDGRMPQRMWASEFVRTFVNRIKIEGPSIQLPLPIDSAVMKAS
jgi:hypothetical protein